MNFSSHNYNRWKTNRRRVKYSNCINKYNILNILYLICYIIVHMLLKKDL